MESYKFTSPAHLKPSLLFSDDLVQTNIPTCLCLCEIDQIV